LVDLKIPSLEKLLDLVGHLALPVKRAKAGCVHILRLQPTAHLRARTRYVAKIARN